MSAINITNIDLIFVKEYLKVDYNEDDTLIASMISAAQSFIQTYLKKKFSTMIENNEEIPDEFTIAALAIIAHWYENRSIQTDKDTVKELPFVFSGILDMHRNWN